MAKSDKSKLNETVYKRSPIAKKVAKNKTATLTIKNKSFRFEKTIIIGRDKSCNITLNDPLVSRRHAKITVIEGKKFYIEDLNSTNGTYVNNNPILKGKKILLKKNDKIRMGSTTLVFNFI